MKEFMMIFIGADYTEQGLSPNEIQEQMGKWFSWVDKLKEKEIYLGGNALTSNAKGLSGKTSIATDGPFAEMSEIITGYMIFKAENMDEAVEVAKDFPDFDYGGKVEVREVMKY